MLLREQQAIIAQCTPQGTGALALIRISGDDAVAIASRMATLASDKLLIELPTHTIHYGWIVDQDGAHIDQVLFLLMHAPRTFTGQNTVEITCHNNPFIIDAIIAQAIAHGARIAQPGEFSQRAFMNGKIDLVQAESINELIHANTQQALKLSLAQVEGSLSSWVHTLEQELLKARVYCEASFEFLDEEISFAPTIKATITQVLTTLGNLKASYGQQNRIRQGLRIALIGSVNAGKSSLFNGLLGKDRAIVTNIAGTTRDVIEAGVYRDGAYWTLIDTAGLRQTDNVIEQEGIKRSFDEAHKADLVLLVYDASCQMNEQERAVYDELLQKHGSKVIVVRNKVDLATQGASITDTDLATSCEQADSIANLQMVIAHKVAQLLARNKSPFLVNKRQFNLLLTLEQHLHKIDSMLAKPNVAYELLAYELKVALEQLTELTGKSVDEAVMDMVFRQFCVGK